MVSRTSYQREKGAGTERLFARRMARSIATQHITREYQEIQAPASHFPNAFVRFPPVQAHPVDQPDDTHPCIVLPIGDPYLSYRYTRVHELAVDIELEMGVGGVADAHRTRTHVAFEVGQLFLVDRGTAVDAGHQSGASRPVAAPGSAPSSNARTPRPPPCSRAA